MMGAIGLSVGTITGDDVDFIGMSLGGIIGVGLSLYDLLITSDLGGASYPPDKYVFNVTGGDITDIILNGDFEDQVRASVLESLQDDGEDVDDIYDDEVNVQMTGLDLISSHGLFSSGSAEPLLIGSSTADLGFPTNVLLQQMTGDTVVPNDNSALLGIDMNLVVKSDGEGSTDSARVLWKLDPNQYSILSGTESAGHGFLIDFETTATAQGQWQAVCFLKNGITLDPSKTISTDCTN